MIRFMRKFSFLALVAALAVSLTAVSARAEIKLGVLAKRGAPQAMAEWGPTGEYLSGKVGDKVTIVPLKFEAIEPMVKEGKIDFVLANSAFFVGLEDKYKAKAIVTMINSREGKALDKFGGVIFVKAGSPINTLADLKGKKFMLVARTSFGGGLMAWKVLKDAGINPEKDFAAFVEGGKHDNVVLAVQNGAMDAGTVRSDTLERMQAEGKIKMSDFKIINQVKDDFPFVHSTPLYPEWPIAAVAHVKPDVSAKVAEALKAMPKDSPAAKAGNIVGWAAPANYGPVRDLLKKLGVSAAE
ncbi:MAG: phosphate/phosphite/phosphonate ABC transporter substrate-binding protein [Thermodesulfobacteriota bacterium]